MGARKIKKAAVADLLGAVRDKLRPPFGIVLGSPREAAELAALLAPEPVICWQMDLFQADRLRQELASCNPLAKVVSTPDLWDMEPVQSLLLPTIPEGDRHLKLDLIEQAFHTLHPGGRFAVLLAETGDKLFSPALKKVFRTVHVPPVGAGGVFWCQRDGERPRRRHEVSFHVRRNDAPSLVFLSRPGTFAYGFFDDGARALCETMEIHPGDRVIDIGCGAGTNGVLAGLQSGSSGFTAFADSNARAVALAEHNARANGLSNIQGVTTWKLDDWPEHSFDVALANPPYYAQLSIAEHFINRSHALLKPGGRFFLVTKQPDQVGPMVAEVFGPTEGVHLRGYTVLCAGQLDPGENHADR